MLAQSKCPLLVNWYRRITFFYSNTFSLGADHYYVGVNPNVFSRCWLYQHITHDSNDHIRTHCVIWLTQLIMVIYWSSPFSTMCLCSSNSFSFVGTCRSGFPSGNITSYSHVHLHGILRNMVSISTGHTTAISRTLIWTSKLLNVRVATSADKSWSIARKWTQWHIHSHKHVVFYEIHIRIHWVVTIHCSP